MPIQIEAIKFNHSANNATADPVNIRQNGTEFREVPEWRRGQTPTADDSVAAYLSKNTAAQTTTIQARFSSTSPQFTIRVRALDETGQNVLGEVVERSVNFGFATQSPFVTFELANTRLFHIGVGSHVVNWQWQARVDQGAFTNIGRTSHRIFTVLAEPTLPWTRHPFVANNLQLPWVEVLEWACRWANGATTLDEAARLVTRNVFDLGEGTINYDQAAGDQHYSFPEFFCKEFLELLAGGEGRGPNVNCLDTATIVSTFANILGCDLSQAQMGGDNFDLNPIRPIGFDEFSRNFGHGGFLFHEVAWTGNCGVNDHVFDACLQVDGDADPTTAPHQPLLPQSMRFGNVGDGQYRDKLAPPTVAGGPKCRPRPETKRRRRIHDVQSPDINFLGEGGTDFLFDRFDFSNWNARSVITENTLVWNFRPDASEFTGWHLENVSNSRGPAIPLHAVESVWARELDGEHFRATVDIYECDSRVAAHRLLLELIAQCTLPDLPQQGAVGELAFSSPTKTLVLFARGNVAVRVSDISKERGSVLELARLVDTSIEGKGTTRSRNVQPAPEEFDLMSDSQPEGLPLLRARDWNDPDLTFRFSSKTGEFRIVNNVPFYIPAESAAHEIEASVLDNDDQVIEELILRSS